MKGRNRTKQKKLTLKFGQLYQAKIDTIILAEKDRQRDKLLADIILETLNHQYFEVLNLSSH